MLDWPKDAIVVVASRAGEEIREQMDSAHDGVCFDCGSALVYDGFTVRRVELLPDHVRLGRPIKFMCQQCFPKYNFGQVTHFQDHRQHKRTRE